MKKNYLIIVGLLAIIVMMVTVWRFTQPEDTWLCKDGVWVAHGNPSSPQPLVGCGDSVVVKPSDIEIFLPQTDEEITSPLTITGQARGSWYFEAVFPIQLTTIHGLILGNTTAQAQGDWMTNEFVPFTAVIEFTSPVDIDQGELIFEKANPSGLPEHGAEVRVPVKFKLN